MQIDQKLGFEGRGGAQALILWAQTYCQKISIQDLFEIETEYFIQKVTSQVEEYRMKKMTGAKIKQSDEIFDVLSIEELEKR